jgi:HEPN domain-containing protein
MKPITAEWIAKAEGDYASLERECRARNRPNYDSACFHAQQCAEKYIKARLADARISFGKTHELVSLLETVVVLEPLWEAFREDLAFLSDFAVTYRYPGESAGKITALNALKRCKRFREAVRPAFGLRLTPTRRKTRRKRKKR